MSSMGNDFFEYTPYRLGQPYYSFKTNNTIEDLIEAECDYSDFIPNLEFIFSDVDLDIEKITKMNLDLKNVTFRNCRMTGSFLKAENITRLNFDSCKFKKHIKLEVSNLTLEVNNSIDLDKVTLQNNIGSILKFKNNNLSEISTELIPYDNNRSLNQMHINDNTSESLRIELTRLTISKLLIENSKINELSIFSSRVDNIHIKSFLLQDVLNISFKETEMPVPRGSVFISLPQEISSLIIHDVSAPAIKISVERHNSTDKLTINNMELYEANNIDLNNIDLKNLELQNSNASNLTFSNLDIEKLTFSKFIVKSNVYFSNINSKFLNDIIPINFDSVLKIEKNSMLGGIEINPSFLHHFKSIQFSESSISGMKIPSFKPLSEQAIENSKENHGNMDFYRELQAIMLEQNNKHYATIYRALELELRANSKNSYLSWFDRQILKLNFLSNSHATKPEKALKLMLYILLVHFFSMNLEFMINNPNYSAANFFWDNFSYYFKPFSFINDIDFMGYKFSKPFIVMDTFYKILFAYLVYQFIAAFRKFNK